MITLITGNQHKADYLAKHLGQPIEHKKLELDELQSLDLKVVVEHKVKQAYAALKKPVLVEDVALSFGALGKLPGPLIKWFLEELEPAGLCKLVDGYEDRSATAEIYYALYDGQQINYFYGAVKGAIAPMPRGDFGFGWNNIFIPEGEIRTWGEIPDDELAPTTHRAEALSLLKKFLAVDFI